MANEELSNILSKGSYHWNEWRRKHPTRKIDLRRANLAGLNIEKINLSRVDLGEADLRGTYLWGANLTEANLRGANLRKAKLGEAHLSGTNLTETDLGEADLHGAELSRAHLSKAIFDGATFRGANLSHADLQGANLQHVNLSGTDLSYADLQEADLTGADLSGSALVRTNLWGATLTNCRVYGVAVWDVELEGVNQLNLIITPDDQSTIAVDDLEVAQFIYLLLNHKKLRNVLNAVTKKGVLILGRFGGGGLEVLQAVADKLRGMSYLPIIFDFKRPQDHDYTETVKTLTGMVRFVIVDLSGPSVPQELYATVPYFAIPFVPIIEKGRNSYAMFVDLLKYDWVLRPLIEFTSVEELLARMPTEVIDPAEKRHQVRQKQLDELFHRT